MKFLRISTLLLLISLTTACEFTLSTFLSGPKPPVLKLTYPQGVDSPPTINTPTPITVEFNWSESYDPDGQPFVVSDIQVIDPTNTPLTIVIDEENKQAQFIVNTAASNDIFTIKAKTSDVNDSKNWSIELVYP